MRSLRKIFAAVVIAFTLSRNVNESDAIENTMQYESKVHSDPVVTTQDDNILANVKTGEVLPTLFKIQGGAKNPSNNETPDSQAENPIINSNEEAILEKIALLEKSPQPQLPYQDLSITTKKIIQILNSVPRWLSDDVIPLLVRVSEQGKQNPPVKTEAVSQTRTPSLGADAAEAFSPADTFNPRRSKTKLPKGERDAENTCISGKQQESEVACYAGNRALYGEPDPRPLVMDYKKNNYMLKLEKQAHKKSRVGEIQRSINKLKEGNLHFGIGAVRVGDNLWEHRTESALRIITKVGPDGKRHILAVFNKAGMSKTKQNDIIQRAGDLFDQQKKTMS